MSNSRKIVKRNNIDNKKEGVPGQRRTMTEMISIEQIETGYFNKRRFYSDEI